MLRPAGSELMQPRPSFSFGWAPKLLPENKLRHAPVAWQLSDIDHLELAGLGETGTLYWPSLNIRSEEVQPLTRAHVCETGYEAVTII